MLGFPLAENPAAKKPLNKKQETFCQIVAKNPLLAKTKAAEMAGLNPAAHTITPAMRDRIVELQLDPRDLRASGEIASLNEIKTVLTKIIRRDKAFFEEEVQNIEVPSNSGKATRLVKSIKTAGKPQVKDIINAAELLCKLEGYEVDITNSGNNVYILETPKESTMGDKMAELEYLRNIAIENELPEFVGRKTDRLGNNHE